MRPATRGSGRDAARLDVYENSRPLSRAMGDDPIKNVLLPILALSLIMAVPAGAQSVLPDLDSPRLDKQLRTKREKDLGLEGSPQGQREQPAPEDDGLNTDRPAEVEDDDSDVVPGMRPRQPARL